MEQAHDTTPDRRRVLHGLAGTTAAAGFALVAGCARGDGGSTASPATGAGDTAGEGDGTDVEVTTTLPAASATERLRRRLRRATFGLDRALVEEAEALGWDAWLDAQLDPESIDDDEVDAILADYSTLTMDPARRRTFMQTEENGRQRVIFELRHAALVRAVHSRRQLQEVLVDHWNNHFNTDTSDVAVALTKADEDAAFRAGAFGSFADLLATSASSPAMLVYLDNATSRSPSPNENYGRELLELHTVGVDGGYDESDVVDAARVFTGWSVDRDTLEFTFRPAFHDDGSKSVLGWTTPGSSGPGAVEEGRSLLRHLSAHPSTARHVTGRLVRRLVADSPPVDVVDAGVAAWEASDGNIGEVIRAILDPAVFDDSVGPKVSRPFEAVATSLRRVGATVPSDLTDRTAAQPALALHAALRRLGQPLFAAAPPTGYADVAGAWVSTHSVSARWDMAIAMTAAHEALGFDPLAIGSDAGGGGGAVSVADAAIDTARHLWLREPAVVEFDALVAATGLDPDEPADDETRAGLVALALATGVAHER